MKLAINLASRGRASLLLSTVMATVPKIHNRNTTFVVSLDKDDNVSCDMLNSMCARGMFPGGAVTISIQPREDSLGAKFNRVVSIIPDADIYLPMCDDCTVLTDGFDERILDAAFGFPDGIGIVFNHHENLSFTSIQAPTRKLVELMGNKIFVEHFPYWFIDHWLSDLVRMIDRIAFADVRLDCQSNWRPTQEMREPAFWATFYDACRVIRREQATAIIAQQFATPEWQKRILLERFPLVEGHAKLINDHVRSMRGAEPAPDERYERIKAAAVRMLHDEVLPALKAAA
jgi:hypothetical protein